jgi:hypothetical protein
MALGAIKNVPGSFAIGFDGLGALCVVGLAATATLV